jgi:hypothetical protein
MALRLSLRLNEKLNFYFKKLFYERIIDMTMLEKKREKLFSDLSSYLREISVDEELNGTSEFLHELAYSLQDGTLAKHCLMIMSNSCSYAAMMKEANQ